MAQSSTSSREASSKSSTTCEKWVFKHHSVSSPRTGARDPLFWLWASPFCKAMHRETRRPWLLGYIGRSWKSIPSDSGYKFLLQKSVDVSASWRTLREVLILGRGSHFSRSSYSRKDPSGDGSAEPRQLNWKCPEFRVVPFVQGLLWPLLCALPDFSRTCLTQLFRIHLPTIFNNKLAW